MKSVAFNIPKHGEWFKQRSHVVYCEDTRGVIIEDDDGRPVAGGVADSWCPNSVQGHIVVDKPQVLRRLAREFFNYVFITAGRQMVIGTTPSNNEQALRTVKGLGFIETAVIEDGYAPGVDFIVFKLDKKDCKFISKDLRLLEAA